MKNVTFVSYNINGIRAALKKELAGWLAGSSADVVCLQEVKASREQADLQQLASLGYQHVYWFAAEKKGYSGVAVLSKIPADQAHYGMGMPEYDSEGRLLRLDFGDLTLVNTYMPSGTTGDVRQGFKYRWLDDFYDYMQQLRTTRPKLVVCGDFNICHKEIDIHNPVRLKNTSGFLPRERAWVSKFLAAGYLDAFRCFSDEPQQYTWWSYRANSRQKNLGWRIDYFVVSETLREQLLGCAIHSDAVHSDHCPVSLQIKL